MTTAREIVLRDYLEFHAAPSLLTYDDDGGNFVATIKSGAPDRESPDGVTLHWTDGVTGEWAEWYSDLATAVARLAGIIRCVDTDEFFRDGAEGFVRWSDQFFERTILVTPKPNIIPED